MFVVSSLSDVLFVRIMFDVSFNTLPNLLYDYIWLNNQLGFINLYMYLVTYLRSHFERDIRRRCLTYLILRHRNRPLPFEFVKCTLQDMSALPRTQKALSSENNLLQKSFQFGNSNFVVHCKFWYGF